MGNICFKICSCCFGKYRTRKYLRTRYNVERDISIEFENLMDDDTAQQEELDSTITEQERLMLLKHDYRSLIEVQKQTDAAIDEKLVRQEEELRQEEEDYYEAQREAARAAQAEREKHGGSDDKRKQWADLDEEWEIGGAEEDFETFLDAVKARSLAARTRSLPSQVPVDTQSSSSLTSKDKTDDANSSVDLEWEHEAGLQPIPKKGTKGAAQQSIETNPLISDQEKRALAELAIRPNMLNLNTDANPEFEWNSDIEGDEESEHSDSGTLLTQSTDAPIR